MKVDEKGLEAIARAIRDTQHLPPSCDYPQCMCDYECERDVLTVATYIPAARAAITAYEAAKTAEGASIVYDEDRRVEVIERDVPVIWRRAAGGAIEYALDIDTREVIGARIFLPARGAEPVAWKALFETAHGALICIAEAQGDALYARKVADDLIAATMGNASTTA